VDFRKQQREHAPIHIDGTAVDRTDDLKWSTHTDSVVKKAQPHEAEEIRLGP
jgi:hypothetical protein